MGSKPNGRSRKESWTQTWLSLQQGRADWQMLWKCNTPPPPDRFSVEFWWCRGRRMEIVWPEYIWVVGHIYISRPRIIFVDFCFLLLIGLQTKWAIQERKLDTDMAFAPAGQGRLADASEMPHTPTARSISSRILAVWRLLD